MILFPHYEVLICKSGHVVWKTSVVALDAPSAAKLGLRLFRQQCPTAHKMGRVRTVTHLRRGPNDPSLKL